VNLHECNPDDQVVCLAYLPADKPLGTDDDLGFESSRTITEPGDKLSFVERVGKDEPGMMDHSALGTVKLRRHKDDVVIMVFSANFYCFGTQKDYDMIESDGKEE